MKIAILGFAREGKSLLKFLKKSKRFRGAKISILDQRQHTNSATSPPVGGSGYTNAPTRIFGKNYLDHLEHFDLIFRSPGIPYNLSQIQKAIKNGVKFSSATQLFFELCPARVIGITGTKGKGTTSTLLYKILKNCGFPVYLAGNIGKPALDLLPRLNKKSWVILELSSFQLQDLKNTPAHPKIAAILDIFPDHLDAHKNLKEYFTAKANLALHQKKNDAIFYFNDNPDSKKIARKSAGKKIGITGSPFGLRKNFVMAATIAAYLGCPQEKIIKTIKKFKGLEHRMELVRTVMVRQAHHKNKSKIYFYNDSAATNPLTTVAAIDHFHNQSLILIAGGRNKGLDYKILATAIRNAKKLKMVMLFGENKHEIKKYLVGIKNKELRIREEKNFETAVKVVYNFAKKSLIPNSSFIILFSPASASFDMFKDYADRGNQFKKIVKNLKI